jgi:hypothetical protein
VTLGSDGSMEVLSGSQIQAGAATARLQLSRGGELLICPRTGAAISSDAGNKSLLIGINTGAIEFDSHLGAFADTILTPDLRLQLAGPGRFHLALGTAANGDTCLHALRGTEAGIIVSEVMGGGVYQLRPGDAMLFRGGKLAQAEVDTERCGCPPENPPAVPIPAATEALPVQQSAPAAPRLLWSWRRLLPFREMHRKWSSQSFCICKAAITAHRFLPCIPCRNRRKRRQSEGTSGVE